MMEIFIQLAVVLAMNAVSILLFFKDKGINECNDNGKKIGNRKFMIVYSIVFLAVNIGVSVLFSLLYKENTMLFTLKRLALLGMIWPLGYIDFKTLRIPNKFIVYGLALRVVILIFELIFNRDGVKGDILGELIVAAALGIAVFICSLCLKDSVGYGDIKLLIVMALFQGVQGIWSSVFTSLIIIFVFSIIMLVTKKKGKKDLIPFAPAIVAGTFISVILTGM